MVFDTSSKLALGLVTGIVFGVLLQKGRASKHSVIVGQLLFRDWTVLKIMGTAIAVGSVGVYALHAAGLTQLAVKPAQMGGILIGASCFGLGLALLGYCPGTTVAAAGEGKVDAVAGLGGMLAGALVFVLARPLTGAIQSAVADWGKVTWPSWSGTSPWLWVAGIVVVAATAYVVDRRRHPRAEMTDFTREGWITRSEP